MFWTRTPEGFAGVSDIEFKNNKLQIRDKRSGKSITLDASQPF